MPLWCNGSHNRLKICCSLERAGSSPASGTTFMNPDKQPNPKIHLYISLVKSLVRIIAGCALVSQFFIVAGWGFITAEILGVLEELF